MISVAKLFSNVKYRQEINSNEWKSYSKSIRNATDYCQCCRRKDVQLNVHHHNYDPDRHLWEYGSSEVSVLCTGCHHAMHEGLKKFRSFVFGSMTPQSLRALNGALAIAMQNHDPLKFAYAVAEMAASPGSVERFAKAFTDRPTANNAIVKKAIEQIAPSPAQSRE